MSRVAVASTDGIAINEHFGRSKEFWIYEVAETGEYQFIERRESNAQAAHAGKGHSFTAQLLADVEVVLATQIGPRAEQELQSYGVIALPVSGPIDKALKTYGKRRKFIKDNIPRASITSHPGGCGGCSHGCK
ncbi:NifB/NifX family molybdenum-iron cluster-binding protein [Sporomusa sp.]|uniref:NifB/NifX family molybdenum-iron cluster-binding protein n=1 Tax=Sporomusa sp. TaxID=2078658 RepID=UPI002B8F4349|nr:NifB/NifX family molybdenum-iron cluster-binding protein [Sporomusa sp.]HWR09581.1 NifB/NifX family molybdenum-iron cluster-binding protein [Sporomusa sp.]